MHWISIVNFVFGPYVFDHTIVSHAITSKYIIFETKSILYACPLYINLSVPVLLVEIIF